MSNFIIQAMLAGIFIALAAGPMGCFLVWRRMAYFGDSMSHSALVGIALGISMGVSYSLGIMLVCILFAVALGSLELKGNLATDTLLGILAHSSLSLGLIWISLMSHPINLEAILFGDILTITYHECMVIVLGVLIILGCIFKMWPKLILLTLHEDLAFAEGVHVKKIKWIFMALLSMMVAFSVQVIGILLLMSLMIIPAATARQWARTPLSMSLLAMLIGALSVVLGIWGSMQFDVPSAPCIVLCATLLFMSSLLRSSA
ncbi:MAG: iron chelate uptake ABC transporter family permease subunit [Gammaproteobacteria bacterium]|nr:iron chelate uptake ABC transporter family permease subunit [Gammaproteobacteria bacterium]